MSERTDREIAALAASLAGFRHRKDIKIMGSMATAIEKIGKLSDDDLEYYLQFAAKGRIAFLEKMDDRLRGVEGAFIGEDFTMPFQAGVSMLLNLLMWEARDRITKKLRQDAGSR
jgi:hypothetical protein